MPSSAARALATTMSASAIAGTTSSPAWVGAPICTHSMPAACQASTEGLTPRTLQVVAEQQRPFLSRAYCGRHRETFRIDRLAEADDRRAECQGFDASGDDI